MASSEPSSEHVEILLLEPIGVDEPPPYEGGPATPRFRLSIPAPLAKFAKALRKLRYQDILPPILLVVLGLAMLHRSGGQIDPRVSPGATGVATTASASGSPAPPSKAEEESARMAAKWKNLTEAFEKYEADQIQGIVLDKQRHNGTQTNATTASSKFGIDDDDMDMQPGNFIKAISMTILSTGLMFAILAIYGVLSGGDEYKPTGY